MSKVLYIQASPRGQRSKSLAVADAFITQYLQIHPADNVQTLNVFDSPVPSFDGLAVDAKYSIMHGRKHTSAELNAWKPVEKVIEDFKSADKYILAIPMWNFSIPYRLKQYIDVLVQPGYTFIYTPESGYKGLVTGKPILAIYARGGEYKSGTPAEAVDLQKRYIELILGFIGFTDIRSILVEPTLQAGPDVAQDMVRDSIEKAKEIARDF